MFYEHDILGRSNGHFIHNDLERELAFFFIFLFFFGKIIYDNFVYYVTFSQILCLE